MDISKKAKCNACSAKMPDRRSNAPKQTWKQSLYKCSVCNSALPASKFDTPKVEAMGGEFYALLSAVWELRLGHEDQCADNDMQSVL